jgi:tetratricopeptide (TPR) repeat protein
MWQAHGLLRAGKTKDALRLYRQAREVFTHADLPAPAAEAMANEGVCELSLGQTEAAAHSLATAATTAQALGNHRLELAARQNLAGLRLDQGDWQAAGTDLARVAELAAVLDETTALAGAHLGLGDLHFERSELDLAAAFANQALTGARAAMDDALATGALALLAQVQQEQGNLESAGAMWEAAADCAQRTTRPAAVLAVHLGRAGCALEAGAVGAAADHLQTALALAVQLDDPQSQSSARARMAIVHHHRGKAGRAQRELARATELAGTHTGRLAALACVAHLLDPVSEPLPVLPDPAPARLRLAARLCG